MNIILMLILCVCCKSYGKIHHIYLIILFVLTIRIVLASTIKHGGYKINWNRKNNCTVVFSCNTTESLKIPQLKVEMNNIFYLKTKLSFTWSAAGLSIITSAACLRALLALCSPSAAITLALASLAASASAAMALCKFSGTLTSFTSTLSTVTPHDSVATFKED